jgi:hypothetical protein
MATVKLKYVYRDRDRQGAVRWLLRLPGRKSITLKGAYGSPEFMASYQAAIEGAEPMPKKGVGTSGPAALPRWRGAMKGAPRSQATARKRNGHNATSSTS